MNIQATPQHNNLQHQQTRLETIEFGEENIYSFPKGLYGFESLHTYIFAPLPGVPENMNYMLLQSTELPDLCFVVSKMEAHKQEAEMINKSHLEVVLNRVKLNLKDIMIGFIITFNPHSLNQEERVIFNYNAPLVFSKKTKDAWQIVLE